MTKNHDSPSITRRAALQLGAAGLAAGSPQLSASDVESRECFRVHGVMAVSSDSKETAEGVFSIDLSNGNCQLVEQKSICIVSNENLTNEMTPDGLRLTNSDDGKLMTYIKRTAFAQQIIVADQKLLQQRVVWQLPEALSATDVCFSPSARQIAVTVQRLERESVQANTQVPAGCELVILDVHREAVFRVPIPSAEFLIAPHWQDC